MIHAPRLSPVAAGLLLGAALVAQIPSDPPPWWLVQNEVTVSLYWSFDGPAPLVPTQAVTPSWYNPAVTTFFNTPNLVSVPTSTGNGLGLLGSGAAQNGTADLTVDNDPYPDWIKIFWFQFDAYEGTTGAVIAEIERSLNYERAIISHTITPLGPGVDRVTMQAQLVPQPDDEGIDWSFVSAGGTVAIDNLFVSSKCVKPGPDDTGDALGKVDVRGDITSQLGGASVRGVAQTQLPIPGAARPIWVSASASTLGAQHQLFRLNNAGVTPVVVSQVPLGATTVSVPQGPGDLAVETITNSSGLITQQVVWALLDLRPTGGSVTLQSFDAISGLPTGSTLLTFPPLAVVPANQLMGLAFDPSGFNGQGTFWVSFTDAAQNGQAREFTRAGAPLQTRPIPRDCVGLGYDDTLGNFYGFSRQPQPTTTTPILVNGFEWSGYDFQLTGTRFCGDLTIPSIGGPRGGVAAGLEVMRRRGPGITRAPLTLVCVAQTDEGTPNARQWLYELSGPFGFGYSVLGRCQMRNGPPFQGSPAFQVALTGVPNSLFAMLILGFSNQTSTLGSLPIALNPLLGWPESILSISPDVMSALQTPSAPGEFTQTMAIPPAAALGYAPIFFQWLALDSSIQGAFAMSQAGKTVIYP